ncbi:MAG TPA: PQQ-dependent sugar dehydrogenase [Gaiellaceae bacterium]|jgi:glucose/arabinose dehydrogenase|nr:PQQ-dependent sugar dehydrogenase [Gaiellaceae bacterium]
MVAPLFAAAALLVPQQQHVSIQPYASGLGALTAIASTPAEPKRLYAVEQVGRIKYLINGRVRGTFLDIRDRITSGGEQGLLGLAFSPNYRRNHRFYVNYTDRQGNTRVVEFRSRNGRGVKPAARQLLFVRQPYANHNGGELQFDRNGRLYVGMGDGGSAGDPGNRAQNPRQRLGKLLRINPLRRGARWQMIALGLRNPWRFSFDRANGDLYIGDVGQGNWEEIDYRSASSIGTLANYGWRAFEGRARFSNTALGPGQLVSPVFVYSHADSNCSVTGGYVYRGRAVTSAVGRYFFGDYCSGIVWSLRIENGQASDVRREPFRVDSLTSFGEDTTGELYMATGEGRIYKLAG